MSKNREKDALVDLLMTAAFVIAMLAVVKASQNRDRSDRMDDHGPVCENVEDHR